MNGYYLIGERLSHSFSTGIHRAFGRYDYALKELSPAELGPFLEARAFAGLNVTIPYKEAVIPFLDRLDEQAAAIGAVNTVVNRGGELWGYNTDFGGMAAALRRLSETRTAACRPCRDSPLSGKTVLILGTGGTSKTALAVCRALGAGEVVRVSRKRRPYAVTYDAARSDYRNADVVINCTPAGMWPYVVGLPLETADFPNLSAVFDCVYNPLRTRLVLEAQARGIPAAGGLYMLVKQAALACELFTGTPVEDEQVDIIYNDLCREQENIVLIGMPGAGKTTVGRILAQKTGKEFRDIDEEIVKRTGHTIPFIFQNLGETRFRSWESAFVQEYYRYSGLVIATGGGTVLREENVRLLKHYGRLVFLDRPLEQLLPSPDRPLGDTREKLARLYAERYPIYRAAADEIINAAGDPEAVADLIAP